MSNFVSSAAIEACSRTWRRSTLHTHQSAGIFSKPVRLVVEDFYKTVQHRSYNGQYGASSLFDLEELVFFDLAKCFDFTDTSDKIPQFKLLGDFDSQHIRSFFAQRFCLHFLVPLGKSEYDGSDDGGEGGSVLS